MINEIEFGELIAMTKANAKAIEKNAQHITWLYRTIIILAVGIVITVAVKPFYEKAVNSNASQGNQMINMVESLDSKTYEL